MHNAALLLWVGGNALLYFLAKKLWPFLEMEWTRSPWPLSLLSFSGDMAAFAVFNWFGIRHGVFRRPFREGMVPKTDRALAIFIATMLLTDLGVTSFTLYLEYSHYQHTVRTEAQIVQLVQRTWTYKEKTSYRYQLTYRYEDRDHDEHLGMFGLNASANRMVLGPDLEEGVVKAIVQRQEVGMTIPIDYAEDCPGKSWLQAEGWWREDSWVLFQYFIICSQIFAFGLYGKTPNVFGPPLPKRAKPHFGMLIFPVVPFLAELVALLIMTILPEFGATITLVNNL